MPFSVFILESDHLIWLMLASNLIIITVLGVFTWPKYMILWFWGSTDKTGYYNLCRVYVPNLRYLDLDIYDRTGYYNLCHVCVPNLRYLDSDIYDRTGYYNLVPNFRAQSLAIYWKPAMTRGQFWEKKTEEQILQLKEAGDFSYVLFQR